MKKNCKSASVCNKVKRYFTVAIAVFSCFTTCFLNTMVVNAATAKEVKERWYDTRYYPLYQGNEEWQKHTMFDTLDILNPPHDLLLSMSTQELANLMQEHPLMSQITTYYGEDGNQNYATFYAFMETNSDIFYELLRREDGFSCILEAYRNHEIDTELLNKTDYVSVEEADIAHEMWWTEIFGCQFIRYYAHHFTESEYELACQIMEEKKEPYSLLDDANLYYLDLPEIEPPTGEEMNIVRTNYLKSEEIQEKEDKLAAAILQMESEESDSQTGTSDTEAGNSVKSEENNESVVAEPDDEQAPGTATEPVDTSEAVESESSQKVMIVVGIIIGAVCVFGGCALVLQRRKDKK